MNRRVIAIGTATILGLTAVWYFLLWSPQSASLQKARSDAAAAVDKESTLKTQVAALQKQRTQLPALNAQLAKIELAIPAGPLVDKFINALDAAVAASGVVVQTFSPAPPVVPVQAATPTTATTTAGAPITTAVTAAAAATPVAPTTSSISLSLSVGGSYGQLVDFINRLTNLSRLTVIDGVSFSGNADKGQPMTASISAHVFDSPVAASAAKSATSTTTVGGH